MKQICLKFTLFALNVWVITASANRFFNNPDNKHYWGARISYSRVFPSMDILDKKYNCPEYYDLFSSGNGVSLGGIFHLPIVANFYFEPGLSIDYGKFHIKDNAFIGKNGELLQNGGVLKQNSIIYSGLKLPLVLGYHFDFFKDFNLSIFRVLF